MSIRVLNSKSILDIKMLKRLVKKILFKETYISHKFRGVNLNFIKNRIKIISLALNQDPNFIKIDKISDEIFLIDNNQK